jgi:hypothetical protein
MKKIPLTRGMFALIDDDDFIKINQIKWYVSGSNNLYAEGYVNGKQLLMHRFIMKPKQGVQIDHKNRNSLDNRKSNLRFSNKSQNAHNAKLQRNNKIGFKGIAVTKNTYWARIKVKGKILYLGSCTTKREAAILYDNALVKFFGEHSTTNKKLGLLNGTK